MTAPSRSMSGSSHSVAGRGRGEQRVRGPRRLGEVPRGEAVQEVDCRARLGGRLRLREILRAATRRTPSRRRRPFRREDLPRRTRRTAPRRANRAARGPSPSRRRASGVAPTTRPTVDPARVIAVAQRGGDRHRLQARHAVHDRVRVAEPVAASVDHCREVHASRGEPREANRLALHVPRPLGVEIERRIEVGVRRRPPCARAATANADRRRGASPSSCGVIGHTRLRSPDSAGIVEDRPIGLAQRRPRRGDDENVPVRDLEDRIRRKVLRQRGDHAEHEAVVDLVQVQPLREHAVRREIRLDATVELRREQTGDARHPRIRRLRHDEVELLARAPRSRRARRRSRTPSADRRTRAHSPDRTRATP